MLNMLFVDSKPNSDVMNEAERKSQLLEWITQDCERMRALELAFLCAKVHSMPQWCLAAGFVRNLVWDRLHGFQYSLLNDIDLIYFCPLDTRPERDRAIEAYLYKQAPDLPWSVKNQARMHLKNQDPPYLSCIDAMTYWPELETAVGVCYQKNTIDLLSNTPRVNALTLVAPFGVNSLFELKLTANPSRTLSIFHQRVLDKGWLIQYPLLQLIY
ncbi:nucleotidyltransferase family protein [Shewanella putrefaciens]|uniref:nucleotidyltransferase family protein n=1 Tax=Shewanella putrefaciens TaxID=24 RepID=UPI000AC4E374|nr:nucleotidyltransferase family protein [Shewanella putrefaciens]